ncbi:MAG: hypothetical protein KDK27_14795, partial [Leptospiraceae bacterium]|nr:hypothetical protein [Leptospiraceae bacterium]
MLGFYPQLKIAGALLDRADASSQEKILRSGGSEGADSMIMGAGTLATGGGLTTAMNTAMMNMAANMGPLTTMINQYNPLIFTANAIKNVEFATKFSTGKSDGYMWEAQMLAAVKQPIVASGQAAIIAGMGDPEPITKAILLGLGTVLIGLGNSIQVNTTTGERATKMTDAAAINTAITAIGSMLGGANQAAQGTADTMDAAAKLGETSQYMADSARAVANSMELGSQITNVMSTGFTSGIQYDAKGNYQGWSAAGKNGTVVAVDTAIAAFSTWAGSKIKPNTTGMSAFESAAAQGLVSDAISMPLSVLGEYYKHETLGAEYSNYTAMQNPGFERLGALVAIGWQAEFQGRINEQIQSQAYVEYQQQREASNRYNFRQILYGAAATAIRREENADGSVTETVHAERLVNLLDKIFKEQKQEVNRDDIRAMIVSLYGMDGYEPNQHIDFSKISQIFTTLGGSFYQDFNATTTGNILKGVQTEVNQYRRMKFNEAMDQLNSLDWPEAKKQAYALGLSQGDWSAWNEYTQAEEKAYNDALFVGMANSTLQQMESEKISAVRAVMQEVARAQLASYHGAIPMGQMSKSQREAVDEKFGAGTYDWYMSVMESAESHRKEFENQSEIDLFWRGVGNFGADTSHALAYLSNINPAAYVNIGLQKLIYNYRNTGKIDSGVLTRGPISPLDMIELVKRAREEELNTAMAGYMSELDPYESAHFMDGAQRQIDAGYMTAEVVTAVVTEIATLGTGKFINAATKLSMRGLKAA